MARMGGKDRGLFERPSGSGIWWIEYYDENGGRHRESVGKKSLAREMYQRRKAEVRERRFRPESIRRQDVLLRVWIDQVVEARRDRASYRNLKRSAELLKKALGDKPLRQITARDVDRYRVARHEDEVSAQTIYHDLSLLRTAFRVAVDEGLVDRQIVRGLKAPKAHRVRYLTEDEELALFEALPARWHPHVILAVHTGMRQAEQFGLRWDQVDWQAKVIRLEKTKSGHPRAIPLNEHALDALRALPHHIRADWVFAGERKGTRLSAHNFYRRTFLPALEAAGIESLTWHDLRHTFATRLVFSGCDLRTVAELLGHTSLQMVMRYAHLQPGAKEAAVAALTRPAPKQPSASESAG